MNASTSHGVSRLRLWLRRPSGCGPARRSLGGGGCLRGPLVVIAALVVGSSSLDGAGRSVTFRTADGRTVAGLMFDARERPAPAVVLTPMLGRPKDDWQAVAEQLAEANITALAIDLPGAALPADPAELQRWHEPIVAAVAYLAGRPAEVQAGAIGAAGASLAANLTVLAAAADPAIQSIALVSPSLDHQGVRIEAPFAQYGARPALLMASIHDPYAARTVRVLGQDVAGAREVRWSSVAAHGTILLMRDTGLVRQLVEWFQRTLG